MSSPISTALTLRSLVHGRGVDQGEKVLDIVIEFRHLILGDPPTSRLLGDALQVGENDACHACGLDGHPVTQSNSLQGSESAAVKGDAQLMDEGFCYLDTHRTPAAHDAHDVTVA